jgi:hypothetical protein
MRLFPVRLCALALPYSASALARQADPTGYASITVSGQTVRYTLTLSAIAAGPLAEQKAFLKEVGPGF